MMVNNRPKNPGSKKKKLVVIGVGVLLIALSAIAIVYALGASGTPSGETVPVTVASASPTIHPTAQHYGVTSGKINPATIVLPANITVPDTGSFLVIRYLGQYTGIWTGDSETHEIDGSGDHVYAIENTTHVSADFKKVDRSAKTNLTVEIWKDGKTLVRENATGLFGEVHIKTAV